MNHPGESLAMQRAKKSGVAVALGSPWLVVVYFLQQLGSLQVEIGQLRTEISSLKVDVTDAAEALTGLEATIAPQLLEDRAARNSLEGKIAVLVRCYNANHRKDCGE